MIDMHCHILPGIDDGAQTEEDSMALLRAEKEQGIRKIVFTPHFNPERSMRLIDMDVSQLCFENTNYILIEFPTNMRPYGITHTVRNLLDRGYTPILAHVERYSYFTHDPTQLYDLVSLGCVAQVNAAAVVSGVSNKGVSALKYLEWELAHIICSDAHSVDQRPPNTKAAYELVNKKLGEQYARWIRKNTYDIFNNKYFDAPVIQKPKKFLGRWR